MTNLQQNAPVLSPQTLRRLWFGAPVAALGVASLAVVAGLLVPSWQSLQRDTARLVALEELVVQVSLMRQQLRAQDIQEEKALRQKDKLFRMIAGSGDISTLLAVLDREAKLSGVQLDLYQPQAPPAAAAPPAGANPPAAGANPNQPPPPSPMEMAGLQPQSMAIAVRGTYQQLLAFLRRLEALNVLVIQSDLQLEAPPQPTDPKAPPVANPMVTMKLSLTVYGSPEATAGQAAAPAAAAPTAATPASPGAAPAASTPPAAGSTPPAAASPPASTPPASAPAAAQPPPAQPPAGR